MTTTETNDKYNSVLSRIAEAARRCGREPSQITLIAVSKKQSVDAIEALYREGHRDFGENYVQELLEKALLLQERGCDEIRWHFIGHLQTNKVKALMPHVFAVHSVDSERLARELAKRWIGRGTGIVKLPVFIEVNISQEESKSGVPPVAGEIRKVAEIIAGELPQLTLEGLMGVPAASDSATDKFTRLRELELEACRPLGSKGALSMGMSGDFELAIAQGATHVRVGTALFGARIQG